MTKNEKREHGDVLYEAILTLKDMKECKKFFSDLCTVAELRAMEQRFEVAMLLSDGIVNDFLGKLGLGPYPFLSKSSLFLPMLIVMIPSAVGLSPSLTSNFTLSVFIVFFSTESSLIFLHSNVYEPV